MEDELECKLITDDKSNFSLSFKLIIVGDAGTSFNIIFRSWKICFNSSSNTKYISYFIRSYGWIRIL